MCVCACVCAPKTQNTETLPNSANISEPLKKIILTTLLHGASFHQDHLITAQAKDATSAKEKLLIIYRDFLTRKRVIYI